LVLEKETLELSNKRKVLDYIDLLSAKFEYGGKGDGKWDCYHLCREVYHRLGINLPEFDSPDENSLINTIIRNKMDDIVERIDNPEPYCFVGFILRPPFLTHMGIVLEDSNKFIHILKQSGVTVERLDDPIWKPKIMGYYRCKLMKDLV